MSLITRSTEATGGGKKRIVLLAASAIILMMTLTAIVAALSYFYFIYEPEDNMLPTGNVIAPSTTSTSTSTSLTSTMIISTTSITSITPTTTIRIVRTTTISTTCNDDIQNQNEEGIDCGGPCTSCSNPAEATAYCISSKGVTVYMRNNQVCIQCKAIRNYFGPLMNIIDTVDCEDDDNEDECEDMLDQARDQDKQRGYPTWDAYGTLYPGAGVGKIKSITGC